jgi:hypothetical protein
MNSSSGIPEGTTRTLDGENPQPITSSASSSVPAITALAPRNARLTSSRSGERCSRATLPHSPESQVSRKKRRPSTEADNAATTPSPLSPLA